MYEANVLPDRLLLDFMVFSGVNQQTQTESPVLHFLDFQKTITLTQRSFRSKQAIAYKCYASLIIKEFWHLTQALLQQICLFDWRLVAPHRQTLGDKRANMSNEGQLR
jgi:hypothetical protein